MILNQFYVDNLIKTALLEDINYVDITTDYLIPEDQENEAKFLAKADGVLCGIEVALRVFTLIQPDFQYEVFIHDGEEVKKGDIISKIKGKTRTILKGERTALNLLQHMSGISSMTNRIVKIVEGMHSNIICIATQ